MSAEYEFDPPLSYDAVIASLPFGGILADLRFGDHCTRSVVETRADGQEGGHLYKSTIRHRLLVCEGVGGCWLLETPPSGSARIEVFGAQRGGSLWWLSAFRNRFAPECEDGQLEVWDMCNGGLENHPPESGYALSEADIKSETST